jgi:hypothetical protein
MKLIKGKGFTEVADLLHKIKDTKSGLHIKVSDLEKALVVKGEKLKESFKGFCR